MTEKSEIETFFGRCRCCLSYGYLKNMWTEHKFQGEIEVYGEMLIQCFALSWNQLEDSAELDQICDQCVTRLRDANDFKKTVLESQEAVNQQIAEEYETENQKGIKLEIEKIDEIEEDQYLLYKPPESEADADLEGSPDTFDRVKEEAEYEEVEYLEDEGDLKEDTDSSLPTENQPKTVPKRRKAIQATQEDDNDETPKRKWPKKLPKAERHKTYKQYTEEQLRQCIEAVRNGEMTPAAASVSYNIPKKTICAKIKDPRDVRTDNTTKTDNIPTEVNKAENEAMQVHVDLDDVTIVSGNDKNLKKQIYGKQNQRIVDKDLMLNDVEKEPDKSQSDDLKKNSREFDEVEILSDTENTPQNKINLNDQIHLVKPKDALEKFNENNELGTLPNDNGDSSDDELDSNLVIDDITENSPDRYIGPNETHVDSLNIQNKVICVSEKTLNENTCPRIDLNKSNDSEHNENIGEDIVEEPGKSHVNYLRRHSKNVDDVGILSDTEMSFNNQKDSDKLSHVLEKLNENKELKIPNDNDISSDDEIDAKLVIDDLSENHLEYLDPNKPHHVDGLKIKIDEVVNATEKIVKEKIDPINGIHLNKPNELENLINVNVDEVFTVNEIKKTPDIKINDNNDKDLLSIEEALAIIDNVQDPDIVNENSKLVINNTDNNSDISHELDINKINVDKVILSIDKDVVTIDTDNNSDINPINEEDIDDDKLKHADVREDTILVLSNEINSANTHVDYSEADDENLTTDTAKNTNPVHPNNNENLDLSRDLTERDFDQMTKTKEIVLGKLKDNIMAILQNTNATAFKLFRQVYTCCFCNYSKQKQSELKSHNLKCHKRKYEKILVNLLNKDLIIYLDITKLTCNLCKKEINSLKDIFEHLGGTHSKVLHNNLVNYIIPFKFDIKTHECLTCGKHYEHFSSLVEHANIHYEYICLMCKGYIDNLKTMKMHSRGCSVNKPMRRKKVHKCPYCSRKFSSVSDLGSHMTIGTPAIGTYNYKRCKACTKRFSSKKLYDEHQRSVHSLFRCHYCNKVFCKDVLLLQHIEEHLALSRYSDFFQSCE